MALLFLSLVLLSSTQTFLLARVQHCQPLSQSKFIRSEYCIPIMRESYACGLKTSISEADPGEGPGGARPPMFGPNCGPRGRDKCFFLTAPSLSQGQDDPPPPRYLKVWIRHWISRIKDNFSRQTHKPEQIVLNT